MEDMSSYEAYQKELMNRFLDYREKNFAKQDNLFEQSPEPGNTQCHVFRKSIEDPRDHNILVPPYAKAGVRREILEQVPSTKRHRWFGSMKSSQALAQSVFGNLNVLGKLDSLSDLITDLGQPLFPVGCDSDNQCQLEHSTNNLNEPVPTEIDVFFSGKYRVAVECKFAESEIGACSMPNPKKKTNSSESRVTKCNGRYEKQGYADARCYLTNRNIDYWKYIPQLFTWDAAKDHAPCPIRVPYQLVRNILSVCVTSDGKVETDARHVVLVYDERNPAFRSNGKGFKAWDECKKALKFKHLLQKCSWQQIAGAINKDSELNWLITAMLDKYGIE